VTVIGGNLEESYPKIDLLQDEQYLAENAAITADCALRLLADRLPVSFCGCPVLIIGWGRIGKCLAAMLKALGAEVTVAARKPSDLGMLTALGYKTAAIGDLDPAPYRAIINTAPAPVLSAGGNAIKIDLASCLGMAGEDVIWARGLPGKMLPEASGALIARCVLRHLREGTV
jgi:dipicolinate synthase subunit A